MPGTTFFAERDPRVLEAISHGEYMAFGMQGKIERVQGTYKYFPTAYGKEIIAAGLTIRNLVLVPALA